MIAFVRIPIAVIAILACALPAWAGKYTPEQIKKAVKDLGDRSFFVREKASRLLWSAGVDAEGPLQAALKSGDAEAVRRARALLDKFQWGIFPDTPSEVVELIGRYRNGDRNVRMQVVEKLTDQGQPGFAVVKRLADMETDANERQAIYSKLAENAQRAVPPMLMAGKLDVVEDLLERLPAGRFQRRLYQFRDLPLLARHARFGHRQGPVGMEPHPVEIVRQVAGASIPGEIRFRESSRHRARD